MPTKLLIGISSAGIISSNNVICVSNNSPSTGITYSDSQPTTLSVGMTWIGNQEENIYDRIFKRI